MTRPELASNSGSVELCEGSSAQTPSQGGAQSQRGLSPAARVTGTSGCCGRRVAFCRRCPPAQGDAVFAGVSQPAVVGGPGLAWEGVRESDAEEPKFRT